MKRSPLCPQLVGVQASMCIVHSVFDSTSPLSSYPPSKLSDPTRTMMKEKSNTAYFLFVVMYLFPCPSCILFFGGWVGWKEWQWIGKEWRVCSSTSISTQLDFCKFSVDLPTVVKKWSLMTKLFFLFSYILCVLGCSHLKEEDNILCLFK